MSILALEEHYFQKLLERVYEYQGLDCRYYKPCYLKRRLAVRMRATSCSTYREYEKLLASNPQEYDLLLDRLTINVSHFFRDPNVYQQLKRLVLPLLAQQKQVRVWSAGCANGEEAYSLAILMREYMPPKCSWGIMATDIDPKCLSHAREGVYKGPALAEVPSSLRQIFFRESEGQWEIIPELRKRVSFERHDLTGKLPQGHFDLIVCRNVLIYFISHLQVSLFKGFHKLLAPNGFLVLGKTESMLGELRSLYTILDIRERIYQCNPALSEKKLSSGG